MLRVLLLLTLVCVMSSSLVAEDPIESAKVALDKAKQLYSDTTVRAKTDLQTAVTREIKRQRVNSKKSVEDQLAHIETLERELRLFENEDVLPKAEVLKDEVTDYKESLRKAKLKCEKAFDALAQRYVTAKDDSNAKLVLADKDSYFGWKFKPGAFQLQTNPPLGRAVVDLNVDGSFKSVQDESYSSAGTWSQVKEEVVIRFDNTNYGTVTLKSTDRDHLTGQNIHTDGQTWNWKLVRLSAVTFSPGTFLCTTVPDEGEWTWVLKNDGTHTNTRDGRVFSGNWEQAGEEIVFRFAEKNFYENEFSSGRLKIVDKDHLSGTNVQNNGQTWKWTVVRKSPTETKK